MLCQAKQPNDLTTCCLLLHRQKSGTLNAMPSQATSPTLSSHLRPMLSLSKTSQRWVAHRTLGFISAQAASEC